jgi:serine/threonine-protein kinase
MAMVYRAHDLMLERPVAIKVLRPDYSQDAAFREHFRQEAKAAANLSHANIVTVHDFGLDAGRLFIVMEFIPGTDLKTIIKRRGRFTIDEAIELISQACDGIGYAHRAGLVHCDVKPQNMLVTPDNRLKVTDFGIARALSSIHPDEQSSVVWGSPQYFSPEQAAGNAPSPASDVYSLGIILYEMLTGKLPFISNDPHELTRMHQSVQPVPPSRHNSKIPQPLEQIILKILSKEPSARYRTADQLGRILKAYAKQENLVFTISTPVERPVATTSETTPVLPVDSKPHPRVHTEPVSTPATPPDWVTITLGLLALVTAGGLIPFWIYIWFTLTAR